MWRKYVEFLVALDSESLKLKDLFSWAETNCLSYSEPDSVGVIQLSDKSGNLLIFGQADSYECSLCIFPISWWPLASDSGLAERERFDREFFRLRSELESVLGRGAQKTDEHMNHYFSTHWDIGAGRIFLYQDERDPQFGAELALSYRKSGAEEAW